MLKQKNMSFIVRFKRKVHAKILHFFRLQLEKNNFVVTPKPPIQQNTLVIENYFKTNFNRNALIAYVVNPFITNNFNFHTNQAECLKIAELLKQNAYNVDVINWDNKTYIPNKKYALVIDNHDTIERLYQYFDGTIKIFHISSCHWLFQNTRELERLNAIKDKRNVVLKPTRLLSPSKSPELCDVATCLGNEFTASTYAFANKPIHFVPVTSTVYFDQLPKHDFQKVRNNFLWFGSKGFALKGLDIVIETFAQLPHLQLTICAPLHTEPEFCEVYKQELFHTPNIHTVGWVEIPSDTFNSIIENHAAVVSLSFSEGGGASVITCMHGGLIPIVSISNSVDVHDFGLWTREISIASLSDMLNRYQALSYQALEQMSHKAYQYAASHHNMDTFSRHMNEIIVSLGKA